MKNMIKRALAILIVLSLLPTLPIVASAANESVKTVYDFAEAFAIDTTNYSFANASADGTEVIDWEDVEAMDVSEEAAEVVAEDAEAVRGKRCILGN